MPIHAADGQGRTDEAPHGRAGMPDGRWTQPPRVPQSLQRSYVSRHAVTPCDALSTHDPTWRGGQGGESINRLSLTAVGASASSPTPPPPPHVRGARPALGPERPVIALAADSARGSAGAGARRLTRGWPAFTGSGSLQRTATVPARPHPARSEHRVTAIRQHFQYVTRSVSDNGILRKVRLGASFAG
jgi:hypothetical protein